MQQDMEPLTLQLVGYGGWAAFTGGSAPQSFHDSDVVEAWFSGSQLTNDMQNDPRGNSESSRVSEGKV